MELIQQSIVHSGRHTHRLYLNFSQTNPSGTKILRGQIFDSVIRDKIEAAIGVGAVSDTKRTSINSKHISRVPGFTDSYVGYSVSEAVPLTPFNGISNTGNKLIGTGGGNCNVFELKVFH